MNADRSPVKVRISTMLVSAVLLCAAGTAAPAADLYVFCNAHLSLSAADVRDMFLGEKQFAGTLKLVPIDNSAAPSCSGVCTKPTAIIDSPMPMKKITIMWRRLQRSPSQPVASEPAPNAMKPGVA